jgi:CubicO group peptidase (beta-lactamase class C family)
VLRVLLCLVATVAACAAAVAQPAANRVQEGAPAPASVRFDATLAAAREMPRLHSLLVNWRGTLLLEYYFNGARASRPANVKSVSKSIISALVGIAIDRGLIRGVREPIAEYFPGMLNGDANAAKRRITIEDLLTMRSGLESTSGRNYGAWVRSPHWVRFVLSRPLEATPGETIEYSTGNTHLLSAILTRATRVSTWQFAQDALAQPLGVSLPRWTRDPQGVYFGGNEMLMTPRDMIAFGELYLNRGRAKGRQIVPGAWVHTSFVPRGRSYWSDQQYGYGWWIRELAGRRAYFAWGFGGQYIFVIPDLHLVVATTSSTAVGEERRSHRRGVLDLVEDLVLPAVADAEACCIGSNNVRTN